MTLSLEPLERWQLAQDWRGEALALLDQRHPPPDGDWPPPRPIAPGLRLMGSSACAWCPGASKIACCQHKAWLPPEPPPALERPSGRLHRLLRRLHVRR